jgi:hypothetical protein
VIVFTAGGLRNMGGLAEVCIKNWRGWAVTAAILGVLLPALLSPYPVDATQGCGNTPLSLVLDNVTAGKDYEKRIFAKYYDTSDNSSTLVLKVSATDSISSLVTFYDESTDLTNPIDSLELQSSYDWVPITVKFNIPEDSQLGTYTGTIYMDFWPREGTTIGYQGKTAVTINITDRVPGEGEASPLKWWWIAAPIAGLAAMAVVAGFLIGRYRLGRK